MNLAQGFEAGVTAKFLEIWYYGKERGGACEAGRGARMALVSELPICNVYSFAREWAGRTCWYPDLHSHLRLNLCLRPRSIVWPSRADCLATGRSDLIFSKLALPLLPYILDGYRAVNQTKAFSKNVHVCVHIFVSARFTPWISNLLLPVLSTMEKNKWGEGGEKKERKKEGRYRSVVEHRNSARLVDRRPTYT